MTEIIKSKMIVCFPYADTSAKISDRNAIYEVVSKSAYKDMTPRHLKGIGKYKNEKKEIFEFITDEFVNYFSEPVRNIKEFEMWHNTLCEKICEKFSSIPEIELKYGKAQKIVNITFKHLYCFSDSIDKSEYFKYCHIPIDNNVLDWLTKKANISKPSVSWSNIDYNTYIKYEHSVFSWLKSEKNKEYVDDKGNPFSPLELDFEVWISNKNTNDGISKKWKEISAANEKWNKYGEQVMSVFPKLMEK